MTLRQGLSGVALVLLVVSPVSAIEQRARARVEAPPSDGDGASDERKAQPREPEGRKAEPRPAEEPAANSAPPKRSLETPSREESHKSGPVVITPTVVVPSHVDGVTIGRSFTVGSGFTVGHTAPEPVGDSSKEKRSYRHDRADDEAPSAETVFVPVPIYVPVAAPNESSRVPDAPTYLTRGESPATPNGPRSYFAFTPWYSVATGITAGYSVPLPPPSTFEEGNISATLTQTERDTTQTGETLSVVGYANGVGGVAFSINPAHAAVYVDGRFVGSAGDYSPQHEPLLLRFGVYTVELRAKGYATERFPVYVTMGEVTPFSGTMVMAP